MRFDEMQVADLDDRQDEPTGEQSSSTPAGGVGQGEAMVTWALWGLLVIALFVTYTRLDPRELYHVTGEGISGGLSRVLVALNFPIALIAIALVLVALDALSARAWWIGTPAIVMCAVTGWPGVVDQNDLDARAINIVPAIGVLTALGLGLAAARRSGLGRAAGLRFDGARTVVIGVVLVLSLPWIFADLGIYSPEWVFIMERPITGSDGNVNPAVHLGHHHGLDGALLVVSAALLSRVRLRSARLAVASTLYLSLVFAYGAVNFAQDFWNEQLAKRGWVDWKIPGALEPALEPIWLVILAITVGTAILLRHETHGTGNSEDR
jgi:hypothetical protein